MGFVKRILKMYYRDKGSVFFSFLGVFIIIGLYVLFLKNTTATDYKNLEGMSSVLDSWVMAGLIAAASITTSMGAYGIMIDDETNKIYKDFYSSPISRSKITAGYLINGVVVSLLMSIVTFVLAELYIVANGGELLTVVESLKVLAIIILTVFSSSSMVCLIASFVHTSNAYSNCSISLGALVGFLVGAYIPIGNLPSIVQTIIKLFPCSHSAALLRQIMMKQPMELSFANAPDSVVGTFKETMGMTFVYGDKTAGVGFHILYLLISAVLFYLLALLHMKSVYKKK